MDERLKGGCAYCGSRPDTRDHVPSKVLLDEPYPAELPAVGACGSCNQDFSLDEQYLACFIECVICGTTEPAGLRRPKVKRLLTENPKLKHRIETSKKKDNAGGLLWLPEVDRVQKILLKLARGHVAYELYPKNEHPIDVRFAPLLKLSDQERFAFENTGTGRLDLCPEFGTRAFLRVFAFEDQIFNEASDWVVVQPDRYRYAVIETDGLLVKLVLSEYLACTVYWEYV
jgi:hypothetical protein